MTGSSALPKPISTPSPSVSDFGGSFENIGGAYGETQVVAQGPKLIDWIGESADAYTHESLDIQQAAIDVQGVLTTISSEYNTYHDAFQNLVDVTIPDYQEQWDEAIETHDENVEATEEEMRQARARTPEGVAFDDSSYLAEIQRQHDDLEETQDELAQLYNSAVCDVDDAASTAAGNIIAALETIVTMGEDGGVPTRTSVGESLFGDNGGILGTTTSWEVAAEDAEDAVDILSDVNENGMPTEEALREFNERFGDRLSTDPAFAAAFADQMPPQKLLEFAAMMNTPHTYFDGPEHQDQAGDFLTNIGAGMMLATGSKPEGMSETKFSQWQDMSNGINIGDSNGYDEWLGSYLDDLHAAGELTYDETGVSEHSYMTGYNYIAQYVGSASQAHEGLSLSNAFLNGMPGEPTNSSIAHKIVESDFNDTINYPAIQGFGVDGSSDPIINLLAGMDGNPEASRTFLGSDTAFDFGNDNQNMTSYLVSHRNVPWGEELRWNDGGDQLGRVIDEATSLPDAREHAETFNILNGFLDGYTDGLTADQSGWLQRERVDGADRFGHYNPQLRHWTGSILEEYVSDLAREVRTPTGSAGGSTYTQIGGYNETDYSLTLTPELRDAITDNENGLFKDLSFDEPAPDDPQWATKAPNSALSKISVAAATEMRTELTDARIRDHNGESGQTGRYDDAVGDYSALLTNIEMADEAADLARGQDIDSRNSAVQSAVGFVADVFPVSRIAGFDELPVTMQNALKATSTGAENMAYSEWLATDNAEQAQQRADNATERVTINLQELVRDINIDAQNLTGPQSQDVIDSVAKRDEQFQFLTEDGYIIRWEDMTPDQQSAYRNFAQDHVFGDGDWTGTSVNDLPQMVDEAYKESQNSLP